MTVKSTKKPKGSLISFMSNKVKTTGGINLAQGIPGYAPPIELTNILSRISHNNIHQYAPGNGNINLINQLYKKYAQLLRINKENIIITNGATEAISLIFTYIYRHINKKFATLAFDPAYETYINLPAIFRIPFIAFKYTADNNIDFNKLEKRIIKNNVKIVFVNTPGNPYGRTWTKEELTNIFQLAKKHKFYIILDVVYKDLYFNDPPPLPYDSFNEYIFYVNSFSKLFSITGWRVGYLICPKKHISNIEYIHDYTGLCTPSVLQEAISLYLSENDNGIEYIKTIRKKLYDSSQYTKSRLNELGFHINKLDGGYFIWCRLPEKYKNGYQFTIDLYDTEKVAIIPGVHFSKNFNNYIRINIARELSEVKSGVEKIKKFISYY